jgi:ABC-type transporter lipoprotein component MlaA
MKVLFLTILVVGVFLNQVSAATTNAQDDDDFGEEDSRGDGRKIIIRDPIEKVNIGLIYFFLKLDKYLIKPISIPYTVLTTKDLRVGITNGFIHLRRIVNLPNSILTFRSDKLFASLGYIYTNTLLGIGGLSDIAKEFSLDEGRVKTSDVFRFYGMPEGFYMVIIVEPATLPDLFGIVIETITIGKFIERDFWLDTGLATLNTRAENSDNLDLISRLSPTFIYDNMKTAKYSYAKYWKLEGNTYQAPISNLKNQIQENVKSEFLL